MSKILVACAKRYNGHELWTLLGVLNERGHSFEVVSQELLIRDELTLQPNTLSRTLYDVNIEEFQTTPLPWDGMCVVSGNMADTEAYWTDPKMSELLVAAQRAGKILAAICCSVPTLWPVVRGVEVSFFPLQRSRRRLKEAGAILRNVAITVDRNAKIATAEHQMATQMWAEEICNLLEGKEPTYKMVDSGYVPQGRPRRMPKEVEHAIEMDKLRRIEESRSG